MLELRIFALSQWHYQSDDQSSLQQSAGARRMGGWLLERKVNHHNGIKILGYIKALLRDFTLSHVKEWGWLAKGGELWALYRHIKGKAEATNLSPSMLEYLDLVSSIYE